MCQSCPLGPPRPQSKAAPLGLRKDSPCKLHASCQELTARQVLANPTLKWLTPHHGSWGPCTQATLTLKGELRGHPLGRPGFASLCKVKSRMEVGSPLTQRQESPAPCLLLSTPSSVPCGLKTVPSAPNQEPGDLGGKSHPPWPSPRPATAQHI